jgi:hypothetical protein
MYAWRAIFDPANVQAGRIEVDLAPLQIDQLADA